ncbi:LPXTG cell wall anchor domain-containing protein, partial [Listeria monocytogenes]|nr:LPXTG cell wall anchor domain-containing protein [Listeria monocytogenes]EIO3608794.1 LPXTG cell wall anchor domain-containing protein [Listeria monocytogenes]
GPNPSTNGGTTGTSNGGTGVTVTNMSSNGSGTMLSSGYSADGTTSISASDLPSTGDTNSSLPWVGLGLFSLAGAFLLRLFRK